MLTLILLSALAYGPEPGVYEDDLTGTKIVVYASPGKTVRYYVLGDPGTRGWVHDLVFVTRGFRKVGGKPEGFDLDSVEDDGESRPYAGLSVNPREDAPARGPKEPEVKPNKKESDVYESKMDAAFRRAVKAHEARRGAHVEAARRLRADLMDFLNRVRLGDVTVTAAEGTKTASVRLGYAGRVVCEVETVTTPDGTVWWTNPDESEDGGRGLNDLQVRELFCHALGEAAFTTKEAREFLTQADLAAQEAKARVKGFKPKPRKEKP